MNGRHAIRLIRVLLSLALAASTGCLIIPVKEGNALSGRKVEPAEVAAWRIGETSRQQVVRQLGEPYAEFRDLRVMVYEWVVVSAFMPWILPGTYAAAAGVLDVEQEHLLLVAYDEAGKIAAFDLLHHNFGRVRARAEQWLAARAGARSQLARGAQSSGGRRGMASVFVYRPGGWSEGINLFLARVLLDGKLVAEVERGSFVDLPLAPGKHTLSGWMRAYPEDATASLSFAVQVKQTLYAEIKVVSGRGSTTMDLRWVPAETGRAAIRKMKREPMSPVGAEPPARR